MRPQPRVQNKKAHEQVTTVTPERPGIPRAMVLTVSFVLSLVTGLCCHHCRRNYFRQRERQRRGVRTTRLRRPPQAPFVPRACNCTSRSAREASTASRPTFVTIASAPPKRRDAPHRPLIWVAWEAEYFSPEGWTGNSGVICPSGKMRAEQLRHFRVSAGWDAWARCQWV